MSSITQMKDAGAYLDSAVALRPTLLTTATAALNTAAPVDRTNYLSGFLSVQLNGTNKAHGAIKAVVKIQHSSVSTAGFTDYTFQDKSTAQSLVAATTATTATQTNVAVIGKYNLNLMHAKKYVRANITPTLTVGSSVVTAGGQVSAVFVFGGKHDL